MADDKPENFVVYPIGNIPEGPAKEHFDRLLAQSAKPVEPVEPEPFRLPPRGVEPLTKPGYPVITDPDSPLWEEQSLGWPNLTAVEAMTEAVRLQKSRRGDSTQHPAFGRDYIRNDQAEKLSQDPPPVNQRRERERR